MARGKVTDRDRGWRKLLAAVEAAAGERAVKVGVLADSEKGGLHVPGSDLTVAEIAAVNEFGTQDGHVPERSFVRSTFDEQREALAVDARKLLVRVLFGGMDVDQALGILGAKLAAEIKKKITTGEEVPPPNAPSTAARKLGHSVRGGAKRDAQGRFAKKAASGVRTLVDTGRMLGAITWALVRGRESP